MRWGINVLEHFNTDLVLWRQVYLTYTPTCNRSAVSVVQICIDYFWLEQTCRIVGKASLLSTGTTSVIRGVTEVQCGVNSQTVLLLLRQC